MTKGGRPPVPRALKLLRGTDRLDRTNAAAPDVEPGAPPRPQWLAAVPWGREAREEWDRLVAVLEPLGILARTDRDALALHADALGRWRLFRRQVAKVGSLQLTPNGYMALSGATVLMQRAFRDVQETGAALGLSPSERQRVSKAPGVRPKNAFARLRKT
jgi:P27 family predicted phage terminase small subunit